MEACRWGLSETKGRAWRTQSTRHRGLDKLGNDSAYQRLIWYLPCAMHFRDIRKWHQHQEEWKWCSKGAGLEELHRKQETSARRLWTINHNRTTRACAGEEAIRMEKRSAIAWKERGITAQKWEAQNVTDTEMSSFPTWVSSECWSQIQMVVRWLGQDP